MSSNRVTYILQQRPEAREVNFVCVWPDHFMSEHFLAVVIVDIGTVSFMKTLAFDHSLFDSRVKTILYF